MASYVVMESPDRADVAYVRDGFHFWAFIAPPLWLAWHRLWIEAALALAALLVIGSLSQIGGMEPVAPVLSLLVSIFVGLEAPALNVAALRRRGWREAGVVDADNVAEAEIRHVYAAVDGAGLDPAEPVVPSPSPSPGAPRPVAGPALGLLAYPGAR